MMGLYAGLACMQNIRERCFGCMAEARLILFGRPSHNGLFL